MEKPLYNEYDGCFEGERPQSEECIAFFKFIAAPRHRGLMTQRPPIDERMTRFWGLWAGFALVLSPGSPEAADTSRESSSPCPGAVAWQEAHRDQLPPAMAQRDQTRAFSAPELRTELERRFEVDQHERRQLMANPRDRDASNKVQQMDRDNLAWLKNLLKTNGVPTVAQVGESGVLWSWLLVQHADDDPQFQSSALPIFARRQAAGELPAEQLAKLTDRVLVAAGKPQRFGTQFDWLSGEFKPRGTGNIADIDINRQALGLMPLADYACMMNGKLKRE